MSINPKDVLNKNKNLNKRIDLYNINLSNISINDLLFNGKNYNEYIHLLSLLENVSSCQISDAYSNVSNRTATIPEIKPINNKKVWGSIFTIETTSDDWGTSALAIDNAREGDVLFFKVDSDDKAIWGELASTCASAKSIKATAVYGAVRDVDTLLKSDYPIFASNFCPNAGSALGLGNLNVSLDVNGFKINSGDFFFGDENGIVVIPKQLFKDTMINTLSVKIKECEIVNAIKCGNTLAEIVNLK